MPIDPEITPEKLARYPKEQFAQLWLEYFGFEATLGSRRDLLARCLAYRVREKAYGGLKPATKRLLLKIAAESDPTLKKRPRKRQIKPGTRLLREWESRVHEVTAGEGAFYYAGSTYKSLSEVARAITGTRWSGPRFFGLEDVKVPE